MLDTKNSGITGSFCWSCSTTFCIKKNLDEIGCVYFKKPIEKYFPIYFFFRLDLAPKVMHKHKYIENFSFKTSFCFFGVFGKGSGLLREETVGKINATSTKSFTCLCFTEWALDAWVDDVIRIIAIATWLIMKMTISCSITGHFLLVWCQLKSVVSKAHTWSL